MGKQYYTISIRFGYNIRDISGENGFIIYEELVKSGQPDRWLVPLNRTSLRRGAEAQRGR